MSISIVDGAEVAKGLGGCVVIIDTFRASNTILSILEGKAKEIYIPSSEEEAAELKKSYPSWVYFGEKDGYKLDTADCDNSPSLASKLDLKGKTAMLYTSRGTKAITKAENAEEVLIASFGNASAIAEYILQKDPKQVTFVSCGESGGIRASEDYRCAQFILSLMGGLEINYGDVKQKIMQESIGARRLRSKHQNDDLEFGLQLDYSNIIPRVERRDGLVVIKGV